MTYFDHASTSTDICLTQTLVTGGEARVGFYAARALRSGRFGPAALRSALPMFLSVLTQYASQSGAVSMARELRRVLRSVYEQEKSALMTAVKNALHRSPEWQARVLEDLGGDAALRRWDARF